MRRLEFDVRDVHRAFDTNRSGHVTHADLPAEAGAKLTLRGRSDSGASVEIVVGEENLGLAARILEYTKKYAKDAEGTITIPAELLREGPTKRALLACDSYDASLRSTEPTRMLDTLLAHPDSKTGVFTGGLRDEKGELRSYRVVGAGGRIEMRRANYDGEKLYLYVPDDEKVVLAGLREAQRSDPKYAKIAIEPISREQIRDRETRIDLRFDRPGVLYVSSRCSVLPELADDRYIVPGGRFGVEAYYHDARINTPAARSTVETLLAGGEPGAREEAAKVLSAMRGTTNVFINQINFVGKALNANLTVYAGRTQPPGLTTCIRETHRAWVAVAAGDPAELARANKWLGWATDAAIREYREVWMSPPRVDAKTGLSRYVDETPSEPPEEAPGHYAGLDWSADDIAADAAIREHGWDSHVGALALEGPDAGKLRQHEMLPICLNSLLYKYERDLAELSRELGRDGEVEGWNRRAETRRATIDRLMWNEETGLYTDLLRSGGGEYRQNNYEDLRAYLPMWAGLVEPGSQRAKLMRDRIEDFQRKGGLAAATEASWDRAHEINPEYVERCQWGHKDIGWPIATYEAIEGLRRCGFQEKADELAYRWCWMVQREMERSGGLQYSALGGFEAPIMEKMDVTNAGHGGVAEVGYGNQGAGFEGEGGGFRWGYDAFKLLARSLPGELRDSLASQSDPDLLFSADVKLAKYRRW